MKWFIENIVKFGNFWLGVLFWTVVGGVGISLLLPEKKNYPYDASNGWYEVLTIDKCEYIVYHSKNTNIVHKQNCKNHPQTKTNKLP